MVLSGNDFFNGAICNKATNRNFNLREFATKFYYTEKKGNGYAIGTIEQRWALGNTSYLMPIVWANDNIWVANISYSGGNEIYEILLVERWRFKRILCCASKFSISAIS